MKKIFLFFVFITTILSACKEDEIMTFPETNGIDGIFFQYNPNLFAPPGGVYTISSRSYVDSMEYNFASKVDETYTIMNFPVCLIGNVANFDRKINFEIDEELTTGVEGVDFEINYDTTYLKANQSSSFVRVKFFRTATLRTKRVALALKLRESENLKLLMDTYLSSTVWDNPSNKTFNANKYKCIVLEQIDIPSSWKEDYFGLWTLDKYYQLNDLMEWTHAMWEGANGIDPASPIGYGTYAYAAFNFRDYLQEKADAGTPIREADGSLMQLPGIYAVDYSKYQ